MRSDLTIEDFINFQKNDFKKNFWIQYFSFKEIPEEKNWIISLTKNMISQFSETGNDKRFFTDCRTILLNLINSILLDGT